MYKGLLQGDGLQRPKAYVLLRERATMEHYCGQQAAGQRGQEQGNGRNHPKDGEREE